MIINGNEIKQDFFLNKFFDFCIVGSGFAADSFVKSLDKKFKILLIESGSFTNNKLSKKLNNYELGSNYFKDAMSRIRLFGGNAALWGGKKRKAKIGKFSKNDFFKKKNWPISYNQLNIFENKALKYFGINKNEFGNKTQIKKFTDSFDETPYYYLYPAKRINTYKEKKYYSKRSNITLIYNLNLVDEVSDKKKVHSLLFKNLLNTLIKIESKNFILSCGGIENSRILLNFAKKNKSFTNKNIGKNFSEHLCVYPLVSIPKKKFIFKNNLTISPKKNIIKKYNIPNFTLQVLDKSKKFYKVFLQLEQNMSKKNLIKLSKNRDIFNLPIAKIYWKLSKNDFTNIRKIQKILINNFKISRDNIFNIEKYKLMFKNKRYKRYITTPHHHMCTTKMGSSDKNSVINKNMRFFGKNNLYILGSSTFSSPSAVNPTFTIVQLSIRLGEYFNKKILIKK